MTRSVRFLEIQPEVIQEHYYSALPVYSYKRKKNYKDIDLKSIYNFVHFTLWMLIKSKNI